MLQFVDSMKFIGLTGFRAIGLELLNYSAWRHAAITSHSLYLETLNPKAPL